MENTNLYMISQSKWEESKRLCNDQVELRDVAEAEDVFGRVDLERYLDMRLSTKEGDESQEDLSAENRMALINIKSRLLPFERLFVTFDRLLAKATGRLMTWGWMFVILKLCEDVASLLLPHFADLISSISDQVSLLLEYDRPSFLLAEMTAATLDMMIGIDRSLTNFIKEIHALQGSCLGHAIPVDKASVLFKHCEDSVARLTAISNKIQRLAHAHEPTFTRMEADLQSRLQIDSEKANVRRYVMLPTHQNARFFGRTNELEIIDRYLLASDQNEFRSLALHGLGGVGKTQTALAYAYSKVEEFEVILWLAAETEIALSTSLTEAAIGLNLAQAEAGQTAHNAELVLQWLQSTSCKWLMIYDNAEAGEFLNRLWPKARRGAILMTTRNVNLSRVPCTGGYEIKSFDTQAGATFLLHLLANQDIGRDFSSPVVQSQALELSAQVGGHALGLTQMVGLITSRGWDLSECLDLYKERPKTLHNLTDEVQIDSNYKFFINTVFREALDGVQKTSAHSLLGILSFLMPDGIPQTLFEPPKTATIPGDLGFCKDPFSFDKALLALTKLALVKKESKGSKDRSLTLHRLVQREFIFYIRNDERQRLFNYTTLLLYHAFPGQVAARFLHSRWPECELFIQHVIAALEHWKDDKELPRLRASLEFCNTLSSAAWYIHELGAYAILETFLESAFLVFEDSSVRDEAKMSYARLHMVAGVMWDNWGHFQKSFDSFMRCLEISLQWLPKTDEFVGGIYNDLGNVSESLGKPQQALDWHRQAWDIRSQSDDPTGENIAHCKSNMARALLMLDKDTIAFRLMDEAGNVFQRADAWFHQAHCNYCKGNYYRKHNRLEEAKREYQISLDLLLDKVKAKNHVRTSACQYKLAAIAIQETDYVKALELLQSSLAICDQQKQNLSDRARVLSKMGEALINIKDRMEEGKRLQQEALKLYRQLAAKERLKATPHEDDYDLLVCGLHR